MGTNMVAVAQKDIHIGAGETKTMELGVTMPSEPGIYPVYIGVFSLGENIGLYKATEDVTITAAITSVEMARWEVTKFNYPGVAVKSTITVLSDEEFAGKLEVCLPGKISGIPLYNYDQWQADIARWEQLLAECDTARCREIRQDSLEETRNKPEIDGFYPIPKSDEYKTKYVVYNHYSKLMVGRDKVEHRVAFPAGRSQFSLGFFIKPDYFDYSYSQGELRWARTPYYLPAVYSPRVNLYDESGNLLHSAAFTDAIRIVPDSAYPTTVEIPQTITSGEEFWMGITMFIPYEKDCDYEVWVAIEHVDNRNYWADAVFGEAVDHNWYNRKDNWYMGGAEAISQDGEFTFRGLLDWKDGYERVPARAVDRDGQPLPPGIYIVKMRRLDLKYISYATDTATKYSGGGTIAEDIVLGTVEVI